MLHKIKARKTELLLFMVFLWCYVYFPPRWAEWNQNSRLDLVLAIVDRGTVSIDDYYQNTGDYALYQGHYYSDKAPGVSFLGVPVYWFFRQIMSLGSLEDIVLRLEANPAFQGTLWEGGSGIEMGKVYFALALTFVTLFAVAIPSAILGVLLYCGTAYVTSNPLYRLGVPLIHGLLTNAFPYSNMFFGHQLAAALLFAAFLLIWRMEQGASSPSRLLLVGFLLGYALITEYPSALIVLGLTIYAFLILAHKRELIFMLIGGVPPLMMLAAYNYAIFGVPFPMGYRYSELYTEQHSTGFLSLSYPRLDALWGITFGSYRGLFFISPVLLLAVVGLAIWGCRREHRRAWWLCVYAVAAFFLFNGSSIMWQGGWAIGPRYLVPALPFLAVGSAYFFEAWGDRLWARSLVFVFSAWSLFSVWAETIGGQHFPDWRPNPLFNYSLPSLTSGDIARNLGMVLGLSGWTSLLPLLAGLGLGLWLLMVSRASPMEGRGV